MHPSPPHPGSSALPKRVLFLNDVSFQYGAGVAQARQAECLLSLGIEAGVLAWAPHKIELEVIGTRPVDPHLWLGIRDVDHLEGGRNLSDEAVIAGLVAEVARFDPDVVLVGNLHAARWPFQLLPALAHIGCRVIAFLHDAYLYTGRCAYPGACRLYLTGCDETCPTATQYPVLAPALIPAAWRIRREIFGGARGIEVVANSHWSKQMFQTALPAARRVDTVELGADERVFQPGDKEAARRQLGLPHDKPVVLCAAVNFQEARKGGHYLREIIASLQDEVCFAAFGHHAGDVPGLKGLGYHLEAAKTALIYQAADIFLGTATEEAFGQTIMEAQLCGLPVVAFQAGGVVEIVRNEITGLLVSVGDSVGAVASIRRLIAEDGFRQEASTLARRYAVDRFSLPAHAERWRRYFTGWRESSVGPNPPTLAYPLNESDEPGAVPRHRPSWPAGNPFLSGEHQPLCTQAPVGGRGSLAADFFKLYEMGYHAGDVILELGRCEGRAAALALRGALANTARTLRPLYFGVAADRAVIGRARQSLGVEALGECCHLFQGDLPAFIRRWAVTPTAVILDGNQGYEAITANLHALSGWLRACTPVLVHDYLPAAGGTGLPDLRKALLEWEGADQARFMGCFGCSALYLTTPPSTLQA